MATKEASPAKQASPEKKPAASPTKQPSPEKAKAATPEKAKEHIKPETQQQQPGMEWKMDTKPIFIRESYAGADKLKGKVALITGGDSGIGRAVAVHFAREGADVFIVHAPGEEKDAAETEALVQKEGRRCGRLAGDVGSHEFARAAVERCVNDLGRLDCLVNNASEQHYHESLADVSAAELERVMRTNVCGYFFFAQAALRHMQKGATIINTTSVVAYCGSANLISYSASKGAETAMTRALANLCAERGVRVNAVAPGPVWTPLIAATFPKERIEAWKSEAPMGRPAHPAEIAPCYVFLACEDAAFYIGQTLHPDGGAPLGL